MKINRCLPVAFLCLLIGTLTACVTVPTSANPLPEVASTSPAVDPLSTSAPLPTPLVFNTQEVQQPTAIASSTAIQLSPATTAPTIPVLPTSTKPVTLSPITPAVTPSPSVLPTTTKPVMLPPVTPAVCEYEWFFPSSGEICPYSTPLASYAVIQPFEHGQMIWVEETDTFYIMFNAGAYPGDSRQVYLNLYGIEIRPGASVDNRVGEPAPAGLYEPVNGFGLIWRNEIEGADLAFVRPSLGWATKPEEGFNTQIQSDQLSIFSFYLLSPQNTVFYFSWTHYIGSMWSEFTPNGLK